MPEISPVIRKAAANWQQPVLEGSAVVGLPTPIREPSSLGRLDGNITSGGETKLVHMLTGVESLEAELFKNKSQLKLLASQVAMHLTREQRSALFASVDRLLAVENWEDESVKIDVQSFRSFLRCIIYANPHRVPNMGVGSNGMILAGWHAGSKMVQAEFLPEDVCVGLIRLETRRGPESVAWRGHVARFRDIVNNNDAIECIDG